jgi:hypothetical protein
MFRLPSESAPTGFCRIAAAPSAPSIPARTESMVLRTECRTFHPGESQIRKSFLVLFFKKEHAFCFDEYLSP